MHNNIYIIIQSLFFVWEKIRIYEKVKDLRVEPRYIVSDFIPPKPGTGKDKNNYPMDKNITFIISMNEGKTEKISFSSVF